MTRLLTAIALAVLLSACDAEPVDTDPDVDTDTDSDSDSDTDSETDPGPVDADDDGYTADVDCDDEDPDTWPGAPEEDCTDPVDRNCDGEVPLFADADFDGVAACLDCDDADPFARPGADEVCDGVDNDCDGLVDDDDEVAGQRTFYLDRDLDGYGSDSDAITACFAPFGYAPRGGDCDDEAAWISPFALERCDGFDNDCDELVDIEDDDIVDQVAWFADTDRDGYGDPDDSIAACMRPSGYVGNDLDCDDRDPDGDVAVALYRDADKDSYGDPATREPRCDRPAGWVSRARDCNDADAAIHPGATERCDSVDNDCDGDIDDDDLDVVGVTSWYPDDDGDGFGADDAEGTAACVAPRGWVADNTDCVDTDVGIHPTRFDWEDSRDNDCDGRVDEDVGSETLTHDADIQGLWNTGCSRCHGTSGGLSLRSGTWARIVEQPSTGLSTMNYIEPGYPDRSYIWLKLNNRQTAAGGTGRSMPTSGPLSQADLDTIESWILQGAVK